MAVSEDQLALLPQVCARAVAEGITPGGVLYVGRREDLLIEFPFGARAEIPDEEPATLGTVYDLASLTKPLVTATVVFAAVERGLLNLMEPLARWLPETAGTALGDVVLRDLLLHVAGLPAGKKMPDDGSPTPSAMAREMARAGLEEPPGKRFLYSDIGYILLGFVAERAFDRPLDELATALVFGPLGMEDTCYTPDDGALDRFAPTEMIAGAPLRGVVHDPTCRAMGGVAGHAGVLGTARDLARYCRMILGRGRHGGVQVLRPASVDCMVEARSVPGGKLRSFGWDVDSQYSSPRGELFPKRGISHTGFTGTSIYIDPPTGTFIILLTNRVHPEPRDGIVRLRRLVANVVASAVLV